MMNNIYRAFPEKGPLSGSTDGSGENALLRPKQMSVGWMIHLVSNFGKTGELVLDTCADIFATTLA